MFRFVSLIAMLVFAWVMLVSRAADDRRFTPDEAFFMTFARDAAVKGDWWLTGSLDKPPLTVYANALALAFIGTDSLPDGVLTLNVYKGEFVGRLLSLFSGMMMLAISARLTLDLTRQTPLALLTIFILATLPMIQLYSATAFMDMPMLALALAAVLTAHRGWEGIAGLMLALAFAAKPQAVYLAPLVLWGIWQSGTGRWQQFRRFAMGAGSVIMAFVVWDVLRPGDSVFALGAANNDFLVPTLSPQVWAQRLQEWLPYSAHFGQPVPLTFYVLPTIILAAGALNPRTRPYSLWLAAYSGGHLVLSGTLYERYLLPIVPFMVVGVMGCFSLVGRGPSLRKRKARYPSSAQNIAAWVVVFSSVWYWHSLTLTQRSAFTDPAAPQVQYPITALDDYNNFAPQIDLLAKELNGLPVASVIYDHWLGWLLNYYMGPWHDKRIVYFPSPEAMADHARTLPEAQNRYFLVPITELSRYGLSSSWSENPTAFIEAFNAAGFMTIGNHIHGFMTVELIPLAP